MNKFIFGSTIVIISGLCSFYLLYRSIPYLKQKKTHKQEKTNNDTHLDLDISKLSVLPMLTNQSILTKNNEDIKLLNSNNSLVLYDFKNKQLIPYCPKNIYIDKEWIVI